VPVATKSNPLPVTRKDDQRAGAVIGEVGVGRERGWPGAFAIAIVQQRVHLFGTMTCRASAQRPCKSSTAASARSRNPPRWQSIGMEVFCRRVQNGDAPEMLIHPNILLHLQHR
jgi:hypothetical protein